MEKHLIGFVHFDYIKSGRNLIESFATNREISRKY